ncbi:MAG: hypothetical protein AB7T22_00495 [Calditrichaceae bacterium]
MKFKPTAAIFVLLLIGINYAEDLHFEINTDRITADNDSNIVVPLKMIAGDDQHLNREPEIDFALTDTARAFVYLGFSVENDTNSDDSYYSGDEIFLLVFKCTGASRHDSCLVKGEISYVHCSETEGWCKRSVQPIEMIIYSDVVRP